MGRSIQSNNLPEAEFNEMSSLISRIASARLECYHIHFSCSHYRYYRFHNYSYCHNSHEMLFVCDNIARGQPNGIKPHDPYSLHYYSLWAAQRNQASGPYQVSVMRIQDIVQS